MILSSWSVALLGIDGHAVEVEAAEGTLILCDAANAAGVTPHQPGETVQLSWRAEDSRLLAA